MQICYQNRFPALIISALIISALTILAIIIVAPLSLSTAPSAHAQEEHSQPISGSFTDKNFLADSTSERQSATDTNAQLSRLPLEVTGLPATVTDCTTFGIEGAAGTLANALATSNVIDFACNGTITVPEILVVSDLVLNGQAGVILDGFDDDSGTRNRILTIAAGVEVEVNDIEFSRGGYGGDSALEPHGGQDGGNIYNAGVLTLNNSVVRSGVASKGAGVYNIGQLTINNVRFEGNKGLDGVVFSEGEGGGIYDLGEVRATNLTISNQTFTNSPAIYYGGNMQIDGCLIEVYISGFGSGWGIEGDGTLVMNDCLIRGGRGAIANNGGRLTVNRTTIDGALNDGNNIIRNSELGTSTLVGVTISNSAIRNIDNNHFAPVGNWGQAFIENTTISGNYSDSAGAISNLGSMEIKNSTITKNSGVSRAFGSSGDGISGISNHGTLTMWDTIVADPEDGINCGGSVPITSNGYNLDSDGTCNLNAAGDIPNGNANLAPLQDNSLPPFTHPLLAGSDAIDAGDCSGSTTLVDQRGISRPQGVACDIGAFELVQDTPPTPTETPTPTAEPTAVPTAMPTVEPTAEPTAVPTTMPTAIPTTEPTAMPTAIPTEIPTEIPTAVPTTAPTVEPTTEPTVEPTAVPTTAPTVEPTVEPTPSGAAVLMQEAENGILSGRFRIGDSVEASSGQYVHVPPPAPNDGTMLQSFNRVRLSFNVTNPGTYHLKGRVYTPNIFTNSFYIQVDGLPVSGYLWHTQVNSGYTSQSVTQGNGTDIVEVELSRGIHVVDVYLREVGAQLDTLSLERVGDGQPAPAPTPIAGCGGLETEAEAGALSGNFAVAQDETASGGAYIHVPDGYGNRGTQLDEAQKVDYCLTVTEPGTYRLKGWVSAPPRGILNNSFYVRVDGSPNNGYLWHTVVTDDFGPQYLTDVNGVSIVELNLEAGSHTVEILLREDGTRLDKLALVPVDGRLRATSSSATTRTTPTTANWLFGSISLEDPNLSWLRDDTSLLSQAQLVVSDVATHGQQHQQSAGVNLDGGYYFDELPAGHYQLQLKLPAGYGPVESNPITVELDGESVVEVSFEVTNFEVTRMSPTIFLPIVR